MITPSIYYEKAKLAGSLAIFFYFMAILFLIGNAPTLARFLFIDDASVTGWAAILAAFLLLFGAGICFHLGRLFGTWRQTFLSQARHLERKLAKVIHKFA